MEISCHSQREVEGPLEFPYITEALFAIYSVQIFVELLLCVYLCRGDKISIIEQLTI